MNQTQRKAALCALLAAALYALNAPVSKLLLSHLPETMMAAFLYLGAGGGMWILQRLRSRSAGAAREEPLTRAELPYVLGMILLDIAAPICLMLGLARTTAENAALLNNFEIVATACIALAVFHERISRRLWAAIGLVTLSSFLLSIEGIGSFHFSTGSLLVLLACVCWGLENNCTRKLSHKDPGQIVVLKGVFSGLGSLAIALSLGQRVERPLWILPTLLLGFVAYGLSIFFYVYAQRTLGAAKTSTYYAAAPFIGVLLSLVMFRQLPGWSFFLAMGIMAAGAWLAATDGGEAQAPERPLTEDSAEGSNK